MKYRSLIEASAKVGLPILVGLFVVALSPELTFAQEAPPAETGETGLGIEENPIYTRLIEIINFLSIGVSVVASMSVVVASFQYMTSRGDPGATSAAVKRLIQAGTAIILYVFGWGILNWLIPGGILN